MFLLINASRHALETPFVPYGIYERGVDGEIAEGRGVCGAFGCRRAGEVVVVRGAEEEDALAVAMIR